MNSEDLIKTAILLAEKHAKIELSKGFKFITAHSYQDERGDLCYFKVRLKHPDGRKWIRPFHLDKEKQIFIMEEPLFFSKKPLYRLSEILKSPNTESVWIVEGENAVDALEKFNILATTSGSSNSTEKTNFDSLRERTVIIWPDTDNPGLKYAEDVTKILIGLNCSIQWIDIEKLNLPEKGDFIDWLVKNPNATQNDIEKLLRINPPQFIEHEEQKNKQSLCSPNFAIKDDGVFYCKDEGEPLLICSKLEVTALTRDNENNNWGRVLAFNDADGVTHTWTMPMELLTGSGEELCRELSRLGLRIAAGSRARKLIVEYITNVVTTNRARCVLRTGWNDDCFILPTKVYGKTNEIVLFQTDSVINSQYGTSGSLQEWIDNISARCVKNSRLMFAVSSAFAGPLLEKLGLESGGFHFRGDSSIGKSTILAVACSVYGGKRYMQNLRTTDNALEGLAAQHNHTLLVLDELSQLNPKIAGEVFYMLANEQSKARASKHGTARGRFTWQLLFLTSGEKSLSVHMQEAGQKSKTGQEVRLIDIPADAGKGRGVFENLHNHAGGAELSIELKASAHRYYGTAIDAFLNQLVKEDFKEIHSALKTTEENLSKLIPQDAHGQVKRVLRRYALVSIAGELATSYGVTGWNEGDAAKASEMCLKAWLNSKDETMGSQENQQALEQVRHFFQENISRFDHFEKFNGYLERIAPPRCAGFKTLNGEFYVLSKTFKDEICKGLDTRSTSELLINEGLLIPCPKTGTANPNQWVPILSQSPRLFKFSNNVLGENKPST